MPQYDLYHDTVKNALVKDGWVITDDPFTIEFKGVYLYADLGAEKLLAAEKSERKIVVEIKVFNWDGIEEGITQELLEAGVAKEDIVLGFYRPERRAITGFSVA